MRIAMYEDRGSVRGGLNRIANRPMQIKMEIRFHPPLSRPEQCFRFSVFPSFFPRSEKLHAFFRDGRRRNFEALTVAKGNFIVYYHRIKGRREKRRKETEERKKGGTKKKGKRNSRYLKGRDISLDCIKSRSNRTEGIGER